MASIDRLSTVAWHDPGTVEGLSRVSAPSWFRLRVRVFKPSGMKGRGLGCLLMARLPEVAKARGLSEIFEGVLQANVAREFGFAATVHPDGVEVV